MCAGLIDLAPNKAIDLDETRAFYEHFTFEASPSELLASHLSQQTRNAVHMLIGAG